MLVNNMPPPPPPYPSAYPPPYPSAYPQAYPPQYGVQQLYPGPPVNDDKFSTTSVIMPIVCCGGPILLASVGMFCAIQGKVRTVHLNTTERDHIYIFFHRAT